MSIPELISNLHTSKDPQENYQTAGRKHNRELFTVEMDGSDLNGLISLLRDVAQISVDYDRIKQCVIYAENIYQQIRRQGF